VRCGGLCSPHQPAALHTHGRMYTTPSATPIDKQSLEGKRATKRHTCLHASHPPIHHNVNKDGTNEKDARGESSLSPLVSVTQVFLQLLK